jgi:hypothetical protein
MNKWLGYALLFLVIWGCVQPTPGKPEYEWITGTWQGSEPAGGKLTLRLSLQNENEVRGLASLPVPTGYSRAPTVDVVGNVYGDRFVLLWLNWPTPVQRNLTRDSEGNLVGYSGSFALKYTKIR